MPKCNGSFIILEDNINFMSSLKYRDDLLEGRQVRLTPVCREHLTRFAAWYSRPGFMRNLTLGLVYPLNIDDEEAWYQRVRDDPNQVVFAILRRDDDLHIGGCGAMETNWQARNTRAFVYIGDEALRSSGYGTDALSVLLRYAFCEMNMHRVGLYVFSYNEAAVSLYRRLGFIEEGRMREAALRDGEFHDIILMSLLAPEWIRLSAEGRYMKEEVRND